MRILILCLVLANLGFLAWVSWVAPAPEPPPHYEGPGITLLRELERDAAILADDVPADDVLADDTGAAGAPRAAACVAIGPFIAADALDAAVARFAAAGFEPLPVASEDEVWDGYWVYIEQIGTRAAADEILTGLASGGIEDAYTIPNSDRGILISLGVFSEISRAGAQAARVGELGYEATISERTRTAETTWLELAADGETDLLGLLREPGRISRLEQRDCQALGAD